jgi:hypothetical protein
MVMGVQERRSCPSSRHSRLRPSGHGSTRTRRECVTEPVTLMWLGSPVESKTLGPVLNGADRVGGIEIVGRTRCNVKAPAPGDSSGPTPKVCVKKWGSSIVCKAPKIRV